MSFAEATREITASYKGERKELIALLQEVQASFGYLPEEALIVVSEFLRMAAGSVYSVATFYNQFRLTPLGKHPIKVCLGTACHMQGGELVLSALERELDLKVGGITADGSFSLDRVACIGCCVMAPVMVIGKTLFPKLDSAKVEEALVTYKPEINEPK